MTWVRLKQFITDQGKNVMPYPSSNKTYIWNKSKGTLHVLIHHMPAQDMNNTYISLWQNVPERRSRPFRSIVMQILFNMVTFKQSIRQKHIKKFKAHTAFSQNSCKVNEAMQPSIREILTENLMAAQSSWRFKKRQWIDRTKYTRNWIVVHIA